MFLCHPTQWRNKWVHLPIAIQLPYAIILIRNIAYSFKLVKVVTGKVLA